MTVNCNRKLLIDYRIGYCPGRDIYIYDIYVFVQMEYR